MSMAWFKWLIGYLELQRSIQILRSVNSFRFKDYFIVPKVSLELVPSNKNRMYSYVKIRVNGKEINRRPKFSPFEFLKGHYHETLTRIFVNIINSVERNASKDKQKAKQIFKQLFNVDVIDL